MKFKRNLKVLNLFKRMLRLKNMENQNKINLEWIKVDKKIKSSSKIINLINV